MTPRQKQALFDNTAPELSNVSEQIRKLHIVHCTKADPAYGKGVAAALEAGVRKKTPNTAL